MIGMVLPQSVFAVATVTVSGDVVTIKTNNAGDLATYLQNADNTKIAEISGATTIVFDGKFCESDLNNLRDKQCCTQKIVDMSEARFVNDYDGADNYTQMKFDNWKGTVEEIVTSKYVTGAMTDLLCSDFQKLKKITLSSGDFTANPNNTKLGNNLINLETIIIKKEVTALSPGMCDKAGTTPNQTPSVQKLKTVTFEEGIQIETLPSSVFSYTGIVNLTIPPSVKEIQSEAFAHCDYLETVTIPENTSLEYIRTNAFQGCDNIEEVHVKVNPNTHPICCEYLAFGEYSLVGQTDESQSLENAKMATLYFNEDYWDYYAGNWKKGMTLAQSQLDAIKDGCDPNAEGSERIKKSFCGNNDDLIDTYTNESNENIKRGWIEGKSPANGWQQFAKTSTGIDIIHEGSYFRTYSTDVPQVRPEWMHIYRITAFSDGFDKNNPNFNNPNSREQADNAEKKATAEEIKEDNTGGYSLIPANTGMIRVDIVTEDAFYYFMDFEDTGLTYNADWEYPYNEGLETDNIEKLNYMYPTGEEDRIIGPVERGNDGKIKYRIFGLLKKPIEGTNRLTGQFSRAKNPTTLAKNRAYLKLPAKLFHWTNESTGSSQNATGEATPSQYAKISLFFDDDFEEVNGGIATEIINAIEENMYKNDSFYTLQGVKVAKPTAKGVYIHNGKKIFIK